MLRFPLRSKRSQPHQDPQHRVPRPAREVPINYGSEDQKRFSWVRWRASGVLSIPLKGPMNGLTQTRFECQCWGSSSEGAVDIREELNWMALEGQLFFPDRNAGGGHCFVVEPFLHRASRQTSYLEFFINLASPVSPPTPIISHSHTTFRPTHATSSSFSI